MLSGHTHKGQFFPFNLITRLIYRKMNYGLNKEKVFQSYTSSGAGTWGPPMRNFSNSEIVVIKLENGEWGDEFRVARVRVTCCWLRVVRYELCVVLCVMCCVRVIFLGGWSLVLDYPLPCFPLIILPVHHVFREIIHLHFLNNQYSPGRIFWNRNVKATP